ncbi:Mu transposase C-terminal domain-containing protein [Paenibacillus sp. HB172176]|uniref:Mu transposase C-terminal domain-containing protein n=1 Tax=Paenibacillus sp. HB172176 TaxID=2493690 RepID=UPI001438CB42|nr:Mu transposase C-terminal domain-containing protein [Paenibacillus sp. HB172176]
MQSFLDEVALENVKSLDELNNWFQVWLSECYQNKPHAALANKQTPEAAFRSDPAALQFINPEHLADSFLHSEQRKVDKVGCINFQGKKYEVGLLFIGQTVQVVYDPTDITEVTIEYEGCTPWKAHELVIGERAGKRPALPKHLQKQPAAESRVLRGAERKHDERTQIQTPAVSYRMLRKEASQDV